MDAHARELLATDALDHARRLAIQEAARLRVSREVMDPESVAGLAAMQWMRSGRQHAAGLRVIVRRRLVDELRVLTGYRQAWGCRHKVATVSLEALRGPEAERPLQVPARMRAADRATTERLLAVFALDLSSRERDVLELMMAYGCRRRRVWEAMGVSESRLAQILTCIRHKAEAADPGC